MYEEIAAPKRLSPVDTKTGLNGKEKLDLLNEKLENSIVRLTSDMMQHEIMEDNTDNIGIKITNVTAKWNEDFHENTLSDVSLDVRKGSLVAVIGPVGCGKVIHVIVLIFLVV